MINKTLIIFDLDQTITNIDTFKTITSMLLTPEETSEIIKKCKNPEINWIPIQNLLYEYAYKHGKDHLSIKKALEYKELFDFLKQNLNKYELIILSSGNKISIEYLLTYNNIIDIFKAILTNPSYINEKGIIKVSQSNKHDCKTCNACQCKKIELNEYFKKNPKQNYDKIIWICDGKNDICLCECLENKDYVFPRKDYDLYKEIYIKNFKEKIRCKIISWKDGFDIINELKKLN